MQAQVRKQHCSNRRSHPAEVPQNDAWKHRFYGETDFVCPDGVETLKTSMPGDQQVFGHRRGGFREGALLNSYDHIWPCSESRPCSLEVSNAFSNAHGGGAGLPFPSSASEHGHAPKHGRARSSVGTIVEGDSAGKSRRSTGSVADCLCQPDVQPKQRQFLHDNIYGSDDPAHGRKHFNPAPRQSENHSRVTAYWEDEVESKAPSRLSWGGVETISLWVCSRCGCQNEGCVLKCAKCKKVNKAHRSSKLREQDM